MPLHVSIGAWLEYELQNKMGIRNIWVGDEPPYPPKEGDIWFDTSTKTPKMYRP